MAIKTYRELEVWEVAMRLVEEVYRLTKSLPQEEKYGLVSQLRRAAVSVPTNIAEGYGRSHRGDYLHHLSFAKGSIAEIETLLTVTARLKMLTRQQLLKAWDISQQVGRMLTKQIAALQRSHNPQPPNPNPQTARTPASILKQSLKKADHPGDVLVRDEQEDAED